MELILTFVRENGIGFRNRLGGFTEQQFIYHILPWAAGKFSQEMVIGAASVSKVVDTYPIPKRVGCVEVGEIVGKLKIKVAALLCSVPLTAVVVVGGELNKFVVGDVGDFDGKGLKAVVDLFLASVDRSLGGSLARGTFGEMCLECFSCFGGNHSVVIVQASRRAGFVVGVDAKLVRLP